MSTSEFPMPPHIDPERYPLVFEANRIAAEFVAKGLPQEKIKLRNAVHFAYDMQRMRIQALLRTTPKEGDKAPPIHLDKDDQEFIDAVGEGLKKTEKVAMREIERICRKNYGRVYEMLRGVRGIGPIGAGYFIANFHVERAVYPSQWAAFAGLHVVDVDPETGRGHAPKVVAGLTKKDGTKGLNFNSKLRSKLLFVVGGCLLKAGNERYGEIYAGVRGRRINQLGRCMNCFDPMTGLSTGFAGKPKKVGMRVDPEAGKQVPCWNCVGNTKNPGRFNPNHAPWGKSDAHRHQDALRRMVRIFIQDVWYWWRTDEKLPVVGTYGEVKLGLRQHSKNPHDDSIETQVLEEMTKTQSSEEFEDDDQE